MTGYRTILFNAIMLAGSLLGFHLAPEQANQYVEAVFLLWGGGNFALRGVTRGPIFGGKKPPAALSSLAMLIVLALSLSACAGAVPWNHQGDAGLTRFGFDIEKDQDGKYHIKSLDFADGKNRGYLKTLIELPGGYKFSYTAVAVEALGGQRVRAEVEKQVSSDAAVAAPGVVKGLGDTVTDIVVPVPRP